MVFSTTNGGGDLSALIVGSAPASGGGGSSCTKSKLASAATRPASKVAPYKRFSYSATFVNSKAAQKSARAMAQAGSFASPFLNTTFSMRLPAGVTVQGYSVSPKLGSAPVVDDDAGLVTWSLGHVQPGKKFKVMLTLVASECSTPGALALNGKFCYFDTVGQKTVDACLKKPLYVWSPGCASKPSNTSGLAGHKTYSTCLCNVCEVCLGGLEGVLVS
jgi:hypothetical protein